MHGMESVKMALRSIRTNKMRTVLTMLGIIIGIASVVAVVGIGEGSRASINKEFENFGVRRAYVMTNYLEEVPVSEWFTHEDVEAVKRVFSDKIVGISVERTDQQKYRDFKREYDVQVTGTNEEYPNIQSMNMVSGRYFSGEDLAAARHVAVIDEDFAIRMFGNADVLGKKFQLDSQGSGTFTYIVIGVFKVPPSMFSGLGPQVYNMFVPHTLLDNYSYYPDKYYYMDINVKEGFDVQSVCEDIIKLVERRHTVQGKDLYMVATAESQMSVINNITGILSAFISSIAAISLLVGGIGIMNIMLVSVTERTREIGIRKAIGANNKDIMRQFIVESIILSGIGGLIGIILGVSISAIASYFIKINLIVSPQIMLLAWGFSAFIGVFFGFYPARKASKLNPIDALRYE